MTRVSGQKRRRRRIISASVFEEKVEGRKDGRTGERRSIRLFSKCSLLARNNSNTVDATKQNFINAIYARISCAGESNEENPYFAFPPGFVS